MGQAELIYKAYKVAYLRPAAKQGVCLAAVTE